MFIYVTKHYNKREVYKTLQSAQGQSFPRPFVHWDVRESMREADIEVILQRAKEKYPEAQPRIISDNGPQLIACDFKELIRVCFCGELRLTMVCDAGHMWECDASPNLS